MSLSAFPSSCSHCGAIHHAYLPCPSDAPLIRFAERLNGPLWRADLAEAKAILSYRLRAT